MFHYFSVFLVFSYTSVPVVVPVAMETLSHPVVPTPAQVNVWIIILIRSTEPTFHKLKRWDPSRRPSKIIPAGT